MIAEQARTYLGVKWKHRGRSRKGIDCAGLPLCVYADLGVKLPDIERYGREPHRDGLMAGIRAALGEPVQGMQVDDVALMTSGAQGSKEPHHIGIIGDHPHYQFSLIHADGTLGVSKVVEVGLSDAYKNRIVAIFRRPV